MARGLQGRIDTQKLSKFVQLVFSGHGTSSANYRPEFLDHFDQKEKEKSVEQSNDATEAPEQNPTDVNSPAGLALQKQLQQIAGGQPVLQNIAVASASNNTSNPSNFQQCIAEGDLEFVSNYSLPMALLCYGLLVFC